MNDFYIAGTRFYIFSLLLIRSLNWKRELARENLYQLNCILFSNYLIQWFFLNQNKRLGNASITELNNYISFWTFIVQFKGMDFNDSRGLLTRVSLDGITREEVMKLNITPTPHHTQFQKGGTNYSRNGVYNVSNQLKNHHSHYSTYFLAKLKVF